jgi:hypothetical protein
MENNWNRNLDNNLIKDLQSVKKSPCISLYMRTYRSNPEKLTGPINFKNLVKKIEDSLLQKYSKEETDRLLENFKTLEKDNDFWNHVADGLGVFAAGNLFFTVKFNKPVDELAIVADSFHTKPLRHYLQTIDKFHIVGVTLDEMILFEGNRHTLTQVNLPDQFPNTLHKALGTELTEEHRTVASYGGVGPASPAMSHGHGGKSPEVDKDAERFFRIIADEVAEKYSKPSGIPMILAALPEHHSLFQQVSKNPNLLSKGIEVNPKSVNNQRLAELAWEVMETEYMKKLNDLKERFEQARANNRGSDSLKEIIKTADEGRIEVLLIEEGRIITKDNKDKLGSIKAGSIDNPEVDDLLDDIGELVTERGGQVFVIPADKMPTSNGLAAIYRY